MGKEGSSPRITAVDSHTSTPGTDPTIVTAAELFSSAITDPLGVVDFTESPLI
jgi:hypothetical protein